MRIACILLLITSHTLAQTTPPAQKQPAPSPDTLILQLKAIDSATKASPNGLPISNRATNIFLSNKIGYYLSSPDDLTLYKNSVLFDAATGTLTVNHSLYQPKGSDQRVGAFTTIGVQANVADALAATYSNRPFDNRFGFFAKQTWITKGHARCTPAQKQAMDAIRAGILHRLEQDTAGQQFNPGLRDEYNYAFALQQSEMLIKTSNYKEITLSWTSVSIYIPLITENIPVAEHRPAASALPDSSTTTTRHAWPLRVNITHTKLWESTRSGRFFLSVAGDLRLNNARDGYQLETVTTPKWIYIGAYSNFLTPTLKGQFFYLPPTSHFGISAHLEQNFGPYHALNGILGVPIVLINKKSEPVCNFEFQIRFFDLSHTVPAGRDLPGRTSIGLTIGVPFSKIAF
ncbi:MAG TPA: hypothetical protein VN824_11595 [Puia sp.]|nr:hypothetical protein [Puia sp.]